MIGQTISHYKITEKLGEGGMGVVYKAEDTKLDRPVALKFLAPHLLRDEEGRKRFEREAKAAAKLDHPNICTVYEIDEADGRTFIAMAFLEGDALSERIKEGPLKLPEALSVAIQMAEGLEAAHQKGITHRDIKPDNVMLMSGSRGLVKLMDFGLAQLAGSSKFTREGTTLGTVNYMSPEQAAGAETGHATDTWSLGVVLYEMVAGQKPFRGDFDQAIVYSIMNEPPEPLTAVRTGVPKELERIVNKCLAKKPEQRYHHTDELLGDLQAARDELEPPPSRVALPRAEAKRRSPVLMATAAAVLLAVLGLGWWFGRSSEPIAEAPRQYNLAQITRDTGYSGDPALSSDGRLLAYTSDRGGEGNLDIWVQQFGGGEPIQLTIDEADDRRPSFSPDGNRIVFLSGREGGGIYVVPALGGSPRRIASGAWPRFSPDGEWLSYSRLEFDRSNRTLAWIEIVPSSGGTSRRVETNLEMALSAVWSPDGKYLLVVGSLKAPGLGSGAGLDWWILPAEGGDAVSLGFRELSEAKGLQLGGRGRPTSWLEEGNWLIFSARMREGGTRHLWRIQVSPGDGRLLSEPQRLTAGTGEGQPSASQDGRIAFVSSTVDWDIWSLPLNADLAEVSGQPERIVSGLSTDWFPSISANGGLLAYTSDRAGNRDVWLRDLSKGAGTDTQITISSAHELRGKISPDGTQVAFHRTEQGKNNVYLTELGRGTERRFLEGIGGLMDWTPDGKALLFSTTPPIRWITVDAATGHQQDLGLEHAQYPVHDVRLSPNQAWVAFKLQSPDAPAFVSRLIKGAAQKEDQWVSLGELSSRNSGHFWWSPDGNTLYFLSRQDEFLCIWAQRLDPSAKNPNGPPKAVQHFHERLRVRGGAFFGYAMTDDKLYLPLGETKGNIWLAEPVPGKS